MSDTIFGLADKTQKKSVHCDYCGRYTGGGTCRECREQIHQEQKLYREGRVA